MIERVGREVRVPLRPGADGVHAWVYDCPGPTLDAPTVLLVHGLGVTAHVNWGRSYRALSRHFRVLAMDLRGHGRGPRTHRFRLEDCADDAVAIADALGIERLVCVGYSLGGSVATLAWRRHPKRIAGLVLAATAAEFGRGRRARWLRRLLPVAALLARARPETLRRLLVERARLRLRGLHVERLVEAELAGHDLPALVQAVGAASGFSSRAWLAEIDVPVAVVVTADDDRIGAAAQRSLAAQIPGAVVLEVAGPHTACVTRPDVFVPALIEACRSVSAGARLDPR